MLLRIVAILKIVDRLPPYKIEKKGSPSPWCSLVMPVHKRLLCRFKKTRLCCYLTFLGSTTTIAGARDLGLGFVRKRQGIRGARVGDVDFFSNLSQRPSASRKIPMTHSPEVRIAWPQKRRKDMIDIRKDDLCAEAVRALLRYHLAGMHENSPPDSVFALDLSGLRVPEVTVWTVWNGEELMGIGALKELGDGSGELKSMRTHPDHLRKGVGALLLDHIVAEARARGLKRLSLETGSGPAFEPALALYRTHGFVDGEPFGDYKRSVFNQFLHLRL
jgi:putative acetyltransferase